MEHDASVSHGTLLCDAIVRGVSGQTLLEMSIFNKAGGKEGFFG